MATSTMRFSGSSSVVSALNTGVSVQDAAIAKAMKENKIVFKIELNANPTKVNARKADGSYKQGGVITNLGGCGKLSHNTMYGTMFIDVKIRPMIKDKALGSVVNPEFNLPIFQLKVEEDPVVTAMNTALQAAGQPLLPITGAITESLVSSDKLAFALYKFCGTPDVKFYFNNFQNVLSEDVAELMTSEKGLLTIWFALDNASIKGDLDEAGQTYRKIDCVAIAATFEQGKTTSVSKPKKVVPAARIEAAFAVLNSNEFDSNLNAQGNIELPESFFTEIEDSRNAFLDSIGTGKKAHKEFKELLESSVAKGQWSKDAEYKLYAIARRGLNIHYTMKNHDIFIAKLKALAGNDVVVVEAPVVEEVVVEKEDNTSSSASISSTEVEDDEEDYGFVPNLPMSLSKTAKTDDDVDIII